MSPVPEALEAVGAGEVAGTPDPEACDDAALEELEAEAEATGGEACGEHGKEHGGCSLVHVLDANNSGAGPNRRGRVLRSPGLRQP